MITFERPLATIPGETREDLVTACGARLEWVHAPSTTLGIMKTFGLYLPPGYGDDDRRYPVLYLFRGHEDEWTGDQDGREGLVPILDRLIVTRRIGPLVVVMPGMMAPDRRTQGAPVNWSARPDGRAVGTGRFEDYFFELKALVERYLQVEVGKNACAVDGFSMGGYSAVLLGTRYPHLFGSVGAYDGSFMWRRQWDPRLKDSHPPDRLWFAEPTAPLFRRDRRFNVPKMERHNPVWLVGRAGGRRLAELQATRFHLRTVADERSGNYDRAHHVVDALGQRGIQNSFDDLVLDPEATHSWKWADKHLEQTLLLHDEVSRPAIG